MEDMSVKKVRDYPQIFGIPGLIAVENIWIDGVKHQLADDGETLIPDSDQSTDEETIIKLDGNAFF